MWMERGCQRNDSLADGYTDRCPWQRGAKPSTEEAGRGGDELVRRDVAASRGHLWWWWGKVPPFWWKFHLELANWRVVWRGCRGLWTLPRHTLEVYE